MRTDRRREWHAAASGMRLHQAIELYSLGLGKRTARDAAGLCTMRYGRWCCVEATRVLRPRDTSILRNLEISGY